MVQVDVFDVFSYDGALDMVGLKVGHGHDEHVGVQAHHEGNEGDRPDVVACKARVIVS